MSKDYAAKRRALIDPNKAIDPPSYGDFTVGSDTTYFTVVDKDRNAVSFINSLSTRSDRAIVAGETGIMLQNRGAGFSLDPTHPNKLEPGKRPFHTMIPAMVFKDGKLLMSVRRDGRRHPAAGTRAGARQPVDRGMNLQQAIDAPRVRYISGRA